MIICHSIIFRNNWNEQLKGPSNEITSCPDMDNCDAVAYNWVRRADTVQVVMHTNL